VQSAVPELRKPDQQDDDGQGVSPAPTAEKDQAAPDVDDDGTLPDEVTADELNKYALSAKRRIRKLAAQRHELRTEVHRLKALEPHAQAADSVSTYLRENDIGRDDFLMLLELGRAARKGEWEKFIAGVEPYYALANQALGRQLAPDMVRAVQAGQMTTEAAVHFTKERIARQLLENQHQRTTHVAQQQQQYYQQQAEYQRRVNLAEAIKNQVNSWEAVAEQRDPDYAAKRNAVKNAMLAVVHETGIPQSPEQGLAIAREAYRRANEQYKQWAPPKRPTSRGPSSTGRTNSAAPEPKSLAEAVARAKESARA
jgi:hypothetical protein